MPGAFQNSNLSPNNIERARQHRQQQRLPLYDLSSTNPTNAGILFPAEILKRSTAEYFSHRRYEPHAKGLNAARVAIAEYYQRRSPTLRLSPENIFLCASTSEAYRMLFSLLCDPGDNILAPIPSYPLFDFFAEDQRIELLPYSLELGDRWTLPQESFSIANELSRAILLVSPHNPTGHVIESLPRSLQNLQLPIIVDEVFSAFPLTYAAIPPIAATHNTLPLFTLNGISKMFALPDLKLAWIALNDRALAEFGERLELLNDCYLNCSSLVQHMLPTLLAEGEKFAGNYSNLIRENAEFAVSALTAQGIPCPLPDGGTNLFLELPPFVDEEKLVIDLIDQGFYAQPGYFFGELTSKHLLLSCMNQHSHFTKQIDDFCEVLAALIHIQKTQR